MINDLFDDLPPGVSHSLYADDSAIWCTGENVTILCRRLQEALRRASQWADRNGFLFSAPKSAVMIFRKRGTDPLPISLRLNRQRIPVVTRFKFLGVVLDSRLTMRPHIDHLREKCAKRLNLFRCLRGTDFGANRITLTRLYKALVLPILEYGAVVYAGGTPSYLKLLDSTQNQFIRLITGAMRTSPVDALYIEANIPPLELRRRELTLRYASKLLFTPTHPTNPCLRILPHIHHNYVGPAEKRSGLTFASRVTLYRSELDLPIPHIQPAPPLCTPPWSFEPRHIYYLTNRPLGSESPATLQQKFAQIRAAFPDVPFLYTDGSKAGDRTANAVICYPGQILRRLPNGTSVFIAELHAILLALQHVQQSRLRSAVICSDSKSAIQSLTAVNTTNHILISVLNLHHRLCTTGVRLSFLWVPGHCGIAGNEAADHSAKQALALNDICPVPLDYTAIKSTIHRAILKHWQSQWQRDISHTQLREIKPDIGYWSSSSRPHSREAHVLTRLRLGHTYHTHSHYFRHEPRPHCLPCHSAITVRHFLIDCATFQPQRRALQVYCHQAAIPFSLAQLLGNNHPDLLQLLFTFLKTTDL